MAPGLLLLRLCLALSAVGPAWTHSLHDLTCHYNYNLCINCEWTSDSSHLCTIQAHKVNYYNLSGYTKYSSSCTLKPSDRPGRRNCSLLFRKRMKSFDVLSLNLSCAHLSQSLVTQYHLSSLAVKLEAPGKPVVNGSSLTWAPPKTSYLKKSLLQYELQWTSQQHPWASGWSKSVQCDCEEQCQAELQAHALVLGRGYSARVRVRLEAQTVYPWSDWGPSLSWESAVGDPSEGAASGGAALWTTGTVVALFLVLVLILITSRTHWVYVMKLVKGAPLPSPAPSVLKMSWQRPPFSSDSFLTFLQPVDIITCPELIMPRPPLSPLLEDKPPLSPLCSSLSSFSNPMYSQLCPTTPLLPCSADSPYGPQPTTDPDLNPDLQSDMGQVLCPELDMLLFLSLTQQCQGVPVVCEYERVEAVGTREDRVRLSSVDSGVGSGEEVSQDSLNPPEDLAVGSSPLKEDPTAPHTPGSLSSMTETPQRDCIMETVSLQCSQSSCAL